MAEQTPMAGRLSGRVCVISGATGGIGRACCRRLAAEGAHIVGLSRDQAAGRALMDDLGDVGGVGAFHAVDVTDDTAVDACWARLRDTHQRIDALVNIVGISGRCSGDGPLHACTDQALDIIYGTNVRSLARMTRAALNLMLSQERSPAGLRGAIVNTSSVLAFAPSRLFATHAYAASKAAIIGLTQAAAAYYAPEGIRLNVLAPGLIDTPMAQRAKDDPATQAYLRDKQPLTGAMGSAEACADAVAYLISDDSAFVTGVVLPVDGGWSVAG